MDPRRFDQLTTALAHAGTRRGLLGLLTTLPVLGGLVASLHDAEVTDAKGRRKRRKKAHKHGKGRRRKHRQHKHKKPCTPQSLATTCAGTCGEVRNNCKQTVNCGPCDCDPPCGVCKTCTGDLMCEPCDPCCHDVCCDQANAVCHADTGACCLPESTAKTCDQQCGDVRNNCGISVDCGPCVCEGGCPECQVCDEETGDCVPDANQEGDACGNPGQVCQSEGTCACDATSCPACTICAGNGVCQGCTDCCDANGDCQDGDTKTACGSSGTCDVCTGQEQCQNQQCVCVPDCTGKVCGPDGCSSTCAPGCPPHSTCAGDGTSCPCDFATCGSTCCADGEDCCGSDCVNAQSDPDHCGDCDTACDGGEDCCSGDCFDLQTDHDHCGSCDNPCGSTQICVAGACQDCDVTCPGGTCAGTALRTALNNGGTVVVCPGRYTGDFTFDTDVTLIGAGQGTDETVDTILDAQQSGRVVDISANRTVALRRLRITGGQTTDPNGGAGVQHLGTLLTMSDCAVSHNQTTTFEIFNSRGAIVNGGLSRLEMTGCTIHDNTVTNADVFGGGVGGGIYNVNQLVLTDCVIRNNAAKTSGGGLFNDQGTAELTNCRIIENTLTTPSGNVAGGIAVNSGSATLSDSFVWDNTAPDCFGNVIGTGCGVAPPD